ncbi:hypothetical protein BDZ94DRAFT_1322929 [Collybia nuda]|uniref:Uncharacterized protein n=1 Tax=Collybia nuda TaxID=64659 RepID=A0A9P5Y4F5_9AGAR|nr:hypothetical protein BDZ94DRAFT_1322929 [Collybia nuda]
MSSGPYDQVEQDNAGPSGGDDLPSYDDLAAQNGPNSRFGRWRGWIEKRAAERYVDITPEERIRRRERGWGNDEMEIPIFNGSLPGIPAEANLANLQIQTSNLSISPPQSLNPRTPSPPLPPLPFVSQTLTPTRVKINQFGSRFLPHATSPIRCLLPLQSDRLLLIGHDEGLSVLDMFPQEWNDSGGITVKGPDEAQSRLIWQGESVFQMSLLEVENTGEGTPQGVVLVLVGPDPDSSGAKESDSLRSLRMYNLASLTSLAKWAVSQKGARPLDLHRPSNWQAQQSPSKRHRPQSRLLARGLKSLIDSPNSSQIQDHSSTLYGNMLSPSASLAPSSKSHSSHSPGRLSPNRREADESSWDVVEDLPLRWATDFVPLATAGSRLVNTSILSYALWSDENRKGRGGRLLAIATKNNILLYETPKGERAFHFVKEFYTPLQPRSITFFQQSVQEINRSSLEIGTPGRLGSHKRTDSNSTLRGASEHSRSPSSASTTLNYGTHLSLFVVFDKKAGWIRLADSAVGEIELYELGGGQTHRHGDTLNAGLSTSSIIKSRMSFEGHHAPKWAHPIRCELPLPNERGMTRSVHLLTRGKQTHIVPCPLPVGPSSYPPLLIVAWQDAPTNISARVCESSSENRYMPAPFLQLVALGGSKGIEVQEISLSFLGSGKGKGRLEEPIRADEDLGGDSGFLCTGGHWDQSDHIFHRQNLNRSLSAASAMSNQTFNSMESEDLLDQLKREEGIYAWCRKGAQDWRVFWVGGSFDSASDEDESDGYYEELR